MSAREDLSEFYRAAGLHRMADRIMSIRKDEGVSTPDDPPPAVQQDLVWDDDPIGAAAAKRERERMAGDA